MHRSADVVVIGAGILGCSIAFELSRRGHDVIVVDRLAGAGYGSTSSSLGLVQFHQPSHDGVALALDSAQAWSDWPSHCGAEDELGFAQYVRCGSLVLESGDHDHSEQRTRFESVGVRYEDLDTEQLTDRFPYLDLGDHGPPLAATDQAPARRVTGAIFTPDAGYVSDLRLAAHNLMRAAGKHGCEFLFDTEVTSIPVSAGRVAGVESRRGHRIAAPVVVNVAGLHSSAVNELAGVTGDMTVGTRALGHEVRRVPFPQSLDFDAVGTVVFDPDGGIAIRPESGTHAFVGDLHDVTDDGIPIYDRSALPGFYMAIGSHRSENAPGVGHLMAELIIAAEAGHDHDSDPVRVAMPFTGLEIELGFWSRRRATSETTSPARRGSR